MKKGMPKGVVTPSLLTAENIFSAHLFKEPSPCDWCKTVVSNRMDASSLDDVAYYQSQILMIFIHDLQTKYKAPDLVPEIEKLRLKLMVQARRQQAALDENFQKVLEQNDTNR